MEKKIIFTIAVISMLAIVFGFLGGMFFESIKVMIVGFGIFSLGLIAIVSTALWNFSQIKW